MNTQRAIQVIDTVTAAVVNGVINTAFIDKLISGKLGNELYEHVLDKWASKKGDVFDFYLNSSDDIKRYPDYDSRITAQICEGKNRSEIYPFETESVHSFFLFGYNHSLDELKKVSPSAWQTVVDNNIARYGDYKNWSLFWKKANREDKVVLWEYINKQ